MSNNSFALSRFDFESGRFTKVCRFITRNWPWDDAPSLSGAQEILAKYLGYDNFYEAKNSATARSAGECNVFYRGDTFVIQELAKYKRPGSEFARTWPVKTLGRWNDNLEVCTFNSEYLEYATTVFDYLWPVEAAMYVGKALKTAPAPVDVRNAEVRDVLTEARFESLLQVTVGKLISELCTVNEPRCVALSKAAGIGYSDIASLPRNEAFFPNLYQHLRRHVQSKWASKNVYNMLTRQRNDHGFYLHSGRAQDTLIYNGRNDLQITKMGDGTLYTLIQNDGIEDSPFRSYTWQTNLISLSGDLLLSAVGSYISGPARKSHASGNLILDLDQIGDADAAIMNAVFEDFIEKEKILLGPDAHCDLTPQTINTQLYFEQGNIVTLDMIERTATSRPGIGADCLLEVISILKRKFRRNMLFYCFVHPYQFTEQSNCVEDILQERMSCESAISAYLMNVVYSHENIVTADMFFTAERKILAGDELLTEYCGKMYL